MKNLKYHYSIYFLGLLLLSLTFFSCKKETNDFSETYIGSMTIQRNTFLPNTNFYSLNTFDDYLVDVQTSNKNLTISIENYNLNLPIYDDNFEGYYLLDSTSNGGYFILEIEINNYNSLNLFLIDFKDLPDDLSIDNYHDRTQITFQGTSN